MSQSRIGVSLAAVSLLLGSAGAHAADAVAGKKFFRAQCALCHSAEASDNGGAQGPDLAGVFDRKAASNSGFSYTPALRASNLTWNAATLDTFLASPAAVVPGTAMVIDVPVKQDRENVTAYFEALKNGTYKDPGPPANAMTGEAPAEESGGPPKSGQDWKLDGFAEVQLLPFTRPQIGGFVRAWYAHMVELGRLSEGAAAVKAESSDGLRIRVGSARRTNGPRCSRSIIRSSSAALAPRRSAPIQHSPPSS